MTIGGIQGGSGSNAGNPSSVSGFEKDVQTQIARIQSQIQKLDSEQEMEFKDKSDRKQELSAQLSELRQELRKRQMEAQRAQREQELKEKKDASMKAEQAENEAASEPRVYSLLQGMDQEKQQVEVSADRKRDRERRLLESEIQTEQSRGMDTEKKEARLESLDTKSRFKTMLQETEQQSDHEGQINIIPKKGTGTSYLKNQDGLVNFNTGSYQL